jgi:hypothetical protein
VASILRFHVKRFTAAVALDVADAAGMQSHAILIPKQDWNAADRIGVPTPIAALAQSYDADTNTMTIGADATQS